VGLISALSVALLRPRVVVTRVEGVPVGSSRTRCKYRLCLRTFPWDLLPTQPLIGSHRRRIRGESPNY
jgi:hypothetical protein